LLRIALKEAYEEGLLLRDIGLNTERGSAWMHRTSSLLKEALPKFYESYFDHELRQGISDDPSKPFGMAADYEKSLEGALGCLEYVICKVDSKKPIKLLPDFNGREWVSEK